VIKLMSLAHADAYPRRFPFLTKLTLPFGTIDPAVAGREWLQDLDRVEQAVECIRTPASFASEAYTLREHIAPRAGMPRQFKRNIWRGHHPAKVSSRLP
jgi:hypothetical protein